MDAVGDGGPMTLATAWMWRQPIEVAPVGSWSRHGHAGALDPLGGTSNKELLLARRAQRSGPFALLLKSRVGMVVRNRIPKSLDGLRSRYRRLRVDEAGAWDG
jgi:hypothetical protein